MEFPPEDWFTFPATDFELAAPRITGDYTVEILAQARPNGRVMDHWRITLGGDRDCCHHFCGSQPPESQTQLPAVASRHPDPVQHDQLGLDGHSRPASGQLCFLPLGRMHQRVKQAGAPAAVPAGSHQPPNRKADLQKVHIQ